MKGLHRRFAATIRTIHAHSEKWLLGWIRPLPGRYLNAVMQDVQDLDWPRRMLDVGSGDGSTSAAFTQLVEKRILTDVRLDCRPMVVANGQCLPFPKSTFDLAVSFEVLEHVPAPEAFTAEVARVLRPGGVLLLTTRQYWPTHNSPGDYFRYTREGLCKIMDESGLVVERAIAMGGPFSVIAVAWDQLLAQLGFGRPVLKQLLTYPFWLFATCLDGLYMRSERFLQAPDTTGWFVVVRRPRE